MLNRRTILAGIGALAATTSFRARAAGVTPELIEAARKEGSITWYIAQVDTQTAEGTGTCLHHSVPRRDRIGDPHDRSGRV